MTVVRRDCAIAFFWVFMPVFLYIHVLFGKGNFFFQHTPSANNLFQEVIRIFLYSYYQNVFIKLENINSIQLCAAYQDSFFKFIRSLFNYAFWRPNWPNSDEKKINEKFCHDFFPPFREITLQKFYICHFQKFFCTQHWARMRKWKCIVFFRQAILIHLWKIDFSCRIFSPTGNNSFSLKYMDFIPRILNYI